MNKDVEKIRAEIEKLRQKVINGATSGQYSSETIREKNQLLVSLLSFIDSMQEEPVSDDFTKALAECIHQAQGNVFDPLVHAEIWKDELIKLAKSEEPVSEELEEAIGQSFIYHENRGDDFRSDKQIETAYRYGFETGAKWQKAKDESTTEDLGEYINELSKQFPEVSFAKLSRIAVRVAKWQIEQIKKAMDLGEPPYLISVEQAYYRTSKLLEE